MTNTDGLDDTHPSAPAAHGIDSTTAPDESASVHTACVDSGSCEHPGIAQRPGPTGPRAALVDGPDVWEVIAALHALRAEDPTRHSEALDNDLRTVTGLTTAQVAAALDYYTAHPAEVDTRIAANVEAAERAQRPHNAGGPPTRIDAT